MSFKMLDGNAGLSSPNVRKIVIDKFGFSWIATQEGLSRFDGNQFVNYNNVSNLSHRLLNSDISDIALDSSGNYLWVLNAYAGLNKLSLQTMEVIKTFPCTTMGFDDSAIAVSRMSLLGNYLFVSSDEGFIIKFDIVRGKVERRIRLPVSKMKSSKIEVLIIVNDKIWIGVSGGEIFVYDSLLNEVSRSIDVVTKAGEDELHFTDAKYDHYGGVVFVSNKGLKVYSVTSFKIRSFSWLHSLLPARFFNEAVLGIYIEKDKGWVSSAHGFYSFQSGGKDLLQFLPAGDKENIDWLNTGSAILKMGDQLWIGSQYGVAWIRKLDNAFTRYFTSYDNDTKLNHCVHLMPHNDSVFYACATDGFYKINLKTANIQRLSENSLYVYCCRLPDSSLLVSGVPGSFRLEDDKLIKLSSKYSELAIIDHDEIVASEQIGDSILFFASQFEKGLYIWNIKRKELFNINVDTRPLRLGSNVINRLYLDRNGILWIVCDNLISSFDYSKKIIKNYVLRNPINKSRLNIIMDICETNNHFWLAVYGMGIFRLTKNFDIVKVYSVDEGLRSLGLYKIFSIGDTAIIASSNIGLALLDSRTDNLKMFYKEDGLQSDNFEEFSGSYDGNILFMGGINGFTKIEPALFKRSNSPPDLYFSNVQISTRQSMIDTFNLFLENIFVPNDFIQIKISYGAINSGTHGRVSYYYRITELDDKWIKQGTQNFIELLGLNPGTYHLEVKAANEDGIESNAINLKLIFLPKWYQTWWFKAMIALLLMGILYGLYRYRLAQIRKEQQIRQRIASDLHDDIGSTLNSVKVFTNLAMMKPENNMTYLQQLKEGVQNAIVGVRDMVWVLDDKQDTLGHLLERIELFINPLAAAQDIRFEKSVDAPMAHILLKKEEKRNLYLIIKEALNNSIKYASATTLQLIIEKLSHERYTVTIRDDGKGFDMDLIQKGNGLNNLQYRAQQIRYAIEIDSVPGKGTTITLARP